MRLLENYKFPNLQSGKKYAYLEANMPGSAVKAGLGGGGTRAPLACSIYDSYRNLVIMAIPHSSSHVDAQEKNEQDKE